MSNSHSPRKYLVALINICQNVFQIGRERETAICLMQKFIDRSDLQIRSAVALDHLKNYIYVEAEKEAHVKEVCADLIATFFGTSS